MKTLRTKLIITLSFLSLWAFSQDDNRGECFEVDSKSLENIVEDLRYIASGDMGGRLAGSSEEEMVVNYIIERFTDLGLQPYGDHYQWTMNVPGFFPAEVSEDTHLRWKKFNPKLGKAFFPTSISSNDALRMRTRFVRYGMELPEVEYSNYTGRKKRLKKRIAVIDIGKYENKRSEQVLTQSVKERVESAIRYGAKGVILINPSLSGVEPSKEYESIEGLGVPVVVLRNPIMVKRLKKWWGRTVDLKVEQKEQPANFRNISAYLDNGAAMTVLITANMDHIGKGNRFSRAPGSNAVHFGADNNASGVVALLELANQLTQDRGFSAFNYLFVLTSGSSNQYGARYTANWLSDNFEGKVSFAIHYSMVGRLSDTRELQMQGLGSFSPDFLFTKKLSCFDIALVQRALAPGNGDHQVFLDHQIPTLKITTGMHDDYNLPSDEVGRINVEGITQIVSLTRTYLQKFEPDNSRALFNEGFQQSDAHLNASGTRRVDWGFEAEWEHRTPGIRIKKIIEGGVAQRAGLQNGDVIIQIGQYPIEDAYHFMDYMQILQPGESRFIRYDRNGQIRPAVVEF